MKAIVYEQYGPPDVLHFAEVPKPVPKEKEVMIRIHASTVTTGDVNARSFLFVPPGLGLLARLMIGVRKPKHAILGTDFAGEIVETGKDVRLFKKGDMVYGIDGDGLGAYAEYKCISEEKALVTKPASLTFEEAASVPSGALTALYFLKDKGNIQGGQKVLVNGASGSVGVAAVQIAKYLGAEVTGVCSTANVELVRSLGADKVIDYTKDDFTQSGDVYDIILDTVVGKTSFARCRKSLKRNGFYLAVAGGLNELIQSVWTSIFGNKKVIFGGGVACERKENLLLIKDIIESGKLKSVIDRCYPLEQTADAHRYVDKGHKKGNVVITVGHDNR